MAFHFRFRQLLRLAEHEESEAKNRLAQKDAQIASIDLKIAEIDKKYDATIEAKAQDLRMANLGRLTVYAAFFRRLENERGYYEDEKERQLQQREKLLAILNEKRLNCRTYEKLRERDVEVYRKAELKREQRDMDEFAGRVARTGGQNV